MIGRLLAVPVLIFLAGCDSAARNEPAGLHETVEEVASSPAGRGTVVRRTTLIVHDIEASIGFYRDVLGMDVWLDSPGTVSERSLPSTASPGDASRLVIMKGRDPWIGMVGLLQYGQPVALPGRPERLVPGHTILMMETDQLDAIWARMQRRGTEVLRPPQDSQVTGADGSRWTARFLFAFDPDGHLLEINQPERPRS